MSVGPREVWVVSLYGVQTVETAKRTLGNDTTDLVYSPVCYPPPPAPAPVAIADPADYSYVILQIMSEGPHAKSPNGTSAENGRIIPVPSILSRSLYNLMPFFREPILLVRRQLSSSPALIKNTGLGVGSSKFVLWESLI